MQPFVRSPYNYDVDELSSATGLVCGPSLTHQEFKDECDINTIVRDFGLTGHVPTAARAPVYADFTGIDDYQSALHSISAAQASFLSLPAAVRERFANDPGAFVDWCSDDRNYDEAVKLGLIFKPLSGAPAGGGHAPGASVSE